MGSVRTDRRGQKLAQTGRTVSASITKAHALVEKDRACRVIDFVENNTTRDDRVFFGNTTHEWVLANEIDLYFLADRLPGVRYTQYEPNMVTRREIQEEMIASLEKHHVRVAVLSNRFPTHEDQYAMKQGSKRLDEYMASEFKQVATYGGYRVLLRKE